MSKNRLNLLVVRCLAYVGVVAFIYCASPVFLPWIYVTVEFTEDYAKAAPWMFLIGGYLLFIFLLIAVVGLSRPRRKTRFGIVLWSTVGYILALFFFCLPTIVMHFYSILTVSQAQIIGAILSLIGVMFVDMIFTNRYTEPEREDIPELSRRSKPLPPPKGAIRDDGAMRTFLFKE